MADFVPIDVSVLRRRLEAMLPTALDVLERMVGVNSYTFNPDGVERVGELTRQLFEPMGFEAERQQAIDCTVAERPTMGRHLFLTRQGRSGKRIGLTGHLDTVFTEQDERENDFRWRPSGERIYGPGTVDIKGGNVLIWMVLAALKDVAPVLFDEVTWVVMFNAAEERLSSDFGMLERQRLGADALANLVFEGGNLIDGQHGVITRRKGRASLRAIARGRAAHAGGAHERGANAIVQLGDCIAKLAGLTDYTRELTCNVGSVRGGVSPNRVPHHAEAMAELRAYEPEVLQQGVAAATALDGMSTVRSAADGYAASVEVCCYQQIAPWPRNAGTDRLASLWQAAGAAIGERVVSSSRGGLSDGNFTCDLVPTLDGLGPAGGNLHCAVRSDEGDVDQEYVLPSTFVPRAATTVLGIERMVRERVWGVGGRV